MFSILNITILAFVLTVAAIDLQSRKVPRVLTTVAFFSGILYHTLAGGILSAMAAALAGFLFGVLLFRAGAIGGGDVKLATALGALLGWALWLRAMYIAILAAAAIAVLLALYKGVLRQTLRNALTVITSLPQRGLNAHTEIHVKNPRLVRAPFGIAAAIGTIAALVRV
ncbi:MAG TPA: A24 family peptidase [Terriglobales bacterium]|nr:A24 family peptidase [Terriglobales bacterium]